MGKYDSLIPANKAFRNQEAFAEEHPETLKLAMQAINKWGTGEILLPHAVGLALQEAYEKGKAGLPLIEPTAPRGVMRREKPQQTPQTARVLRRRPTP